MYKEVCPEGSIVDNSNDIDLNALADPASSMSMEVSFISLLHKIGYVSFWIL